MDCISSSLTPIEMAITVGEQQFNSQTSGGPGRTSTPMPTYISEVMSRYVVREGDDDE